MNDHEKTKEQLIQELEALRGRVERYRQISEAAFEGIAVSEQGVLVDANPQLAAMLGYEPEEMIGKPVEHFVAPESLALVREHIRRGFDEPYEHYVKRKDNSIFPVEVYGRSTSWKGLTARITALRDISERKQAEETLRRQHEVILKNQEDLEMERLRYQDLFEFAPDSYLVTTPEGVILEANQESAKLLGIEQAKLIGKTLFGFVLKEDHHLFINLVEALREKNQGRLEDWELRLHPRKGEIFPASATIAPIRNYDYGLAGIRWLIRDLTERKRTIDALRESEERLSFVLEGSQLGFWDWDIESGKVSRNSLWAEMLGYTLPEIEFTIKQWTDLHHPDDQANAWQAIQDHLEGRTPKYRTEYRMRTKCGQYKWILDQAMIVKHDAHGKPLRMSGTHTDITEGKRVEEKIKHSLEEKELLLKEIHHRVKNNLMIISSILSLQSAAMPDPAIQEIFRECENRVKTMSRIHTQLYQSGNLAQINFADYLQELGLDLFRSYQVRADTISLNLKIEDFTPAINTAIPLGLIVNELFTNAIKYAFSGGRKGEIRVSLKKDNSQNVLTVADNGIGLPEDFDLPRAQSLGLQMVTALVQQLDGTLEIKRDMGTVWSITFPGEE